MKKFLLVDDEDHLRDLYESMIRKRYSNAHVDHAGNGREGLKKIEQVDYNAIIVDIDMPVMGGIDFFKALESRSAAASKRTVFISGSCLDEGNSYILQRSRPYLMKPFRPDQFINLLSFIVALDEKKFRLVNGRDCSREAVRFRKKSSGRISYTDGETIRFVEAGLVDYSVQGFSVCYNGEALKPSMEIDVNLAGLYDRPKKAKVVWTIDSTESQRSGFMWL